MPLRVGGRMVGNMDSVAQNSPQRDLAGMSCHFAECSLPELGRSELAVGAGLREGSPIDNLYERGHTPIVIR